MNQASKWLSKAKRFIRAAELLLEQGYYDLACLNAQQAAEFSLKALLIAKTGYKPLTHSITELLDALSELYRVPEEVYKCRRIEEHYLQARYPNSRMAEYTKKEAEEALNCAGVIMSYVEGLLKEAGRKGQG